MRVRYVGPLGDGVVVVHAGRSYGCPHGVDVDLPDVVVHGRPAEQIVDGDVTVDVPAVGGLLDQYEDGRPCWEQAADPAGRKKGDG